MTSDETTSILLVLTGAYPNEVTTEMLHLWSNVFVNDNADAVANAAQEWINHEQFWPTPAGLRKYMRAASDEQRHQHPAPTMCNGSGFIDSGTPCPKCNPAQAEIFNDHDKFQRWRKGDQIHRILGYSDLPGSMDDYKDTYFRSPCEPSALDDPQISGREGGWEIAYKSYCEQVQRQGRTPKDRDTFLGGLIAATA